MTDDEWGQFFELLDKIVRTAQDAAKDRSERIGEQAKLFDAFDALSEFVSWWAWQH